MKTTLWLDSFLTQERGDPKPCLVTDMLTSLLSGKEQPENTADFEDIVIDVAGLAFIGEISGMSSDNVATNQIVLQWGPI